MKTINRVDLHILHRGALGRAAKLLVTLLAICTSSFGSDLAPPELVLPRLSHGTSNTLIDIEPVSLSQQAVATSKDAAVSRAQGTASGSQTGDMNTLTITQQGSGNTANATQFGKNNTLGLDQRGEGNVANTLQQGGNQLSLEQAGVGQRADIQQMMGGQALSIRQTGGTSFIKATQY